VEKIRESYDQGRITDQTIVDLALTLAGVTNSFEDGSKYDETFRAETAYVFGHRYRRLKRNKESEQFFRIARDSALPKSTLHRLAAAELEKSEHR
jgi:hypothetical protein